MSSSFISPLRRAVRANRPDRVREILEKAGRGAPDLINEDFTADCFLDCFQRNTSPVIHTAIAYGRDDIIDILLHYGADPCIVGYWQETALHKACRQNNLALAKKLVRYGADVHVQDHMGSYPVHLAALSFAAGYWNKCEVLHFLVEEVGSIDDVKLEDDAENTPLHNAALRDNGEACRFLLSKGAEPDARNLKGYTPADLASSHSVKSLLQEAMQNIKKTYRVKGNKSEISCESHVKIAVNHT